MKGRVKPLMDKDKEVIGRLELWLQLYADISFKHLIYVAQIVAANSPTDCTVSVNPGLFGERLTISRLSCGTAHMNSVQLNA